MKTMIKQYVSVRSARFLLGCGFASTAFILSLFIYRNLKAGVVFAVMFLISGSFRIPDRYIPKRFFRWVYMAWLIVSAFVILFLSQLSLNEGLPENGLFVTILGVIFILLLFLLLFIITIRIRFAVVAVSAILIAFTCLNYFVFLFRGSEIAPADILSITTAGNVAAEYSFHIPPAMFYSITLCVLYFFMSFALPPCNVQKKAYSRICCSTFSLILVALLYVGGQSITPTHWLQTGSVSNGYLLNFILLFRESFPTKPQQYSIDKVESIAQLYSAESNSDKLTDMPDILVIMDESFADLSRLGNTIQTSIPITPFIDSLQENTLRGYTVSSVFGGGTPNSEYEFLSGNSFLFLPTGSIAYQQFIKTSCYSLASELKQRGYWTIAMHQYNANSWMREQIWPMLGFEECLFLDSFPQKDFLRNWGTDQELFEKIASVYEEHKAASDAPVFVFAVTIQNHGGYEYSGSDFSPDVRLQGYSRQYPDAEQYLTCIHETDKAIQWMIDYYAQIDRNVVILFYGDHFPKLNDAFIEEIHGGPFETLDEQMLQYEVPFFIWTNYPSDFEEIELVSMNYLAGILIQRAGLKLPAYNQFLEDIRQTIPACNAYGFYSESEGRFLTLHEAKGIEKQALQQYSWLEWNNLFDTENRNSVLFPAY